MDGTYVFLLKFVVLLVKDTHIKKASSNKTLALTKSINMDTWVVRTSNQFFVSGS